MPIEVGDIATVSATLVAAWVGAWAGVNLANKSQLEKERARAIQLRNALRVEVEFNGRQARVYLEQNIMSPAYRLQTKIYDSVFTDLVDTILVQDDVNALLSFYSQTSQINWALDEVDKLRAETSLEGQQALDKEVRRLKAKCDELRSPNSRFFTPAWDALTREAREPW